VIVGLADLKQVGYQGLSTGIVHSNPPQRLVGNLKLLKKLAAM
jgi:hypothetical protein